MNATQLSFWDMSTRTLRQRSVVRDANGLTFRDVQRFLDDIPNICAGGCGVAALSLYRWRVKNGLQPGTLVFMYHRSYNLESKKNRARIQSNDTFGLHVPSHVGLKINGRIADTEGYTAHNTCGTCRSHAVSESVLIDTLNTGRTWNPMFQRGQFIDEIESYLEIDLSDIRR